MFSATSVGRCAERTRAPLFSNVIHPRSKRRSACGVSSNPFAPSMRSLPSAQLAQGLMWLARRSAGSVIPVIVLDDAADAVPLARACVAGGLDMLEVTLRTAAGLEAIRRIAAELALMRATDQIQALGLMAIDPIAKAVAPRFWAAVICVPLLTAFFVSLALTASWFQAVQILGVDNGTFWQTMRDVVDFRDDFLVAFLKSAIFGGTAALVAAYVGFHAEPTIEGTSVATTRAVVNASLLVLMFNFVLSALLFR